MAEKENQFQGVVESLLKGMDTVLSTKTVVGEATTIGDTIILPLVDVSFGVGAGAGSNGTKNSASGAGGLGGRIWHGTTHTMWERKAKRSFTSPLTADMRTATRSPFWTP